MYQFVGSWLRTFRIYVMILKCSHVMYFFFLLTFMSSVLLLNTRVLGFYYSCHVHLLKILRYISEPLAASTLRWHHLAVCCMHIEAVSCPKQFKNKYVNCANSVLLQDTLWRLRVVLWPVSGVGWVPERIRGSK